MQTPPSLQWLAAQSPLPPQSALLAQPARSNNRRSSWALDRPERGSFAFDGLAPATAAMCVRWPIYPFSPQVPAKIAKMRGLSATGSGCFTAESSIS